MIGNDMKIGPLWLKLQIACGDALALGPGKADLLDAINDAWLDLRGRRARSA